MPGCSGSERAVLRAEVPEEVRLSSELLKYYTMARWHVQGDQHNENTVLPRLDRVFLGYWILSKLCIVKLRQGSGKDRQGMAHKAKV